MTANHADAVREALPDMLASAMETEASLLVSIVGRSVSASDVTLLRQGAAVIREQSARLAALAGAAPVAYMRRWAFDGVKVMAHRKADRPRGWNLHAVTESKLLDDDAPLYHAPAKAREDDARDARRYRFLRDTADNRTGHPFIARRNAFGMSAWNGEHADAAIDAALATFAEGAETSDERRE